jgi:hypothetical protein
METIEIELYNFSELDENAKKKALDNTDLSNDIEFYWQDAENTLNAFQKIFPIEWNEIDYINGYSHLKYIGEENHQYISGIRLLKLLENNYLPYIKKGKYRSTESSLMHPCLVHKKLSNGKIFHAFYSRIFFEYDNYPLTGTCYDLYLLQPILDFRKNPKHSINFEELLKDCLTSLAKALQREYDYLASDEAKIEYLEDNDLQFLENGQQYKF